MSVRVRYAPSPTGYQHIGGVRTALFNYLFAKSHGGSFIVRVEDTDLQRSKAQYVDDLFQTLQWLGLQADEYADKGPHAPYVQSQRTDIYTSHAKQLLELGEAYYCYTSSIERETVYDRSSRELSLSRRKEYEAQYKSEGKMPVLRLKLPYDGNISFSDMVLGDVTREYKDIIVDPILIKSDGMPTYHFANVVDDHCMNITHVMRSQEWVPTTPVHVYLYRAFRWQAPQFCHLPMVLGDDKQKLSKRNGSMSIQEVKKQGILPEALINCISLLGWSFDDKKEFFTSTELEKIFHKGIIQKSPAQFSMHKLRWFNAHYIQTLNSVELAHNIAPYCIEAGFIDNDKTAHRAIEPYMPMVQKRIETFADAVDVMRHLFQAPSVDVSSFFEDGIEKKESCENAHIALSVMHEIMLSSWHGTAEDLKMKCKTEAKNRTWKLAQLFMPFRIALTGSCSSPPIIEFAKHLSKDEVLARIEKAQTLLRIFLETS